MNSHLLRTEFRLYYREIAAIIFGYLLSPMILLILGSIPSFREPNPDIGGQTVIELYVPIMVAMSIAMVAISTMPVQLAIYRERGIIRRLSTTPAKAGDLLVAMASVQFTVLVAGVLTVIGLGWAAFGVDLPANPAAFVVSFLLTCAALFGLGLLLASLNGSKVVQGIGSVVFFPMMFFAGLWVPREAMPQVLRDIGDFTPLGAGVQALHDASAGSWPSLLHLGVLTGWTALTWLTAIRFFRWS